MATSIAGAVATATVLIVSGGASATEIPGDAGFMVVGSATTDGQGLVGIFADNDNDGTYETETDEEVVYPFQVGDGVRVATGDFNGDGIDEVATAPGAAGPVNLYELGTGGVLGAKTGSVQGFDGGSFVAAGDFGDVGQDYLVVSADAGGPPKVKVYFVDGNSGLSLHEQFNAYPKDVPGGVRVATGDTDGVGADELITVPGGDDQRLKIWDDTDFDGQVSDNPLDDSFRPFGSGFAAGMYVAAGPVSAAGNSGADVMVSRADTGQTVIRTDVDGDGELSDDPVFDTIAGPYPTGGARLAAGDTDHSGLLVEMITAPTTGSRRLQVYDDDADGGALLSDNPLDDSFNPFPGNAAGEYVAFGRAASVVAYADPTTPVEITDNSSTFTTINVPASAGIIRDLDVTIDVSGGLDSDLDVGLTHIPTVTSQTLFTDVGNRHHGFEVRLTDETGTDIASAPNERNHPPLSGTFKPEAPALLSAFDGIDASGAWRLGITDDTALNAATLRDWTLRITY